MKAKLFITAIIATIAIPSLCLADPPKAGGYMSGFIGTSLLNDTTVTTDNFNLNQTFNERVEFDPGFNTGITGGYDFGYVRMEGELSYKNGAIRSITDQNDNYRFRNVDGDLGVFAMMFNGFFDLHNDSPVTPYFGGGVGFATIYLSDTYGTNTRGGTTTRDLLYIKDDDSVLAYQVGGGLEIALNRAFSLDLGYRYFGTSKAKFNNSWDQSSELSVDSHNVTAGFRVKF